MNEALIEMWKAKRNHTDTGQGIVRHGYRIVMRFYLSGFKRVRVADGWLSDCKLG